MASTFSARIEKERLLLEALEGDNFCLFYQPVIAAETGKVAYYEALIRIKGNPSPAAEFIPVAEESNLILPIGRWVIQEAIRQLAAWEKEGQQARPISINVSPKQFYDLGLTDFLGEVLRKEGVAADLLEIEITETVFIDNIEEAIKIIERLKKLGIKITLDDFGTGYSSINYITRIPVDRIKLDRRITEKHAEKAAVVKGLIAIAHGLGMDVVGEGVERIEEARFLKEVGCDYLQGYLFSIPIPVREIAKIAHRDFKKMTGFKKTLDKKPGLKYGKS